jgi:hypothetical protein
VSSLGISDLKLSKSSLTLHKSFYLL